MKILLLLSLALSLSSFDNITASKIFEHIFTAMYDKQIISVYTRNEIYKEVIISASSLELSDECKNADIIIITNLNDIQKECEYKPHFSTSKLIFKEFKNSVGVFYWDRGRISIKFSQSRLQRHGITLPPSFKKYLIKKDL